nr:NAD(P)/FAD-dependent oxidoreductase [Nocardioides perillae]
MVDVAGTQAAEVVVVGAGLAGLACAVELQRHGVAVEVLEASDAVGGRVRTDVVDGFRCDRGFQLLNPSYPAARALVDLDALALQVAGRGVEVLRPSGVARLADPTRHPRDLPATLASGLVRPGELVRLGRWAAPALGSVDRLLRRPDRTLGAALDAAGLRGSRDRLRREVLEPFLTGVVADDPAQVSERFARLLLRSFALATPGLPAAGMQALPEQLARRLAQPVRLAHPAHGVRRRDDAVEVLTAHGTWRARAVVVATDPRAAAALTEQPEPATRGLATWWFTAPEPVSSSPFLRVDGTRGGPVINTTVVSAWAPTYAPAGRPLVAATALLGAGAAPREDEVRRHLAALWQRPTDTWEVVVRHDVPHALPAAPPPLRHRREVDLGGGLLVAGDHRDTGSIQGALVSGRRAARAALAHVTAGAR